MVLLTPVGASVRQIPPDLPHLQVRVRIPAAAQLQCDETGAMQVLILDGVQLQSRNQVWSSPWHDQDHDRTSPAQPSVTIMVVDDDERVRRVTARMLRNEGYNVIEARSGEDALERLAESQVQVILADLAMPGGMHGLELAEQALELAPGRRVVLMSGYYRLFPKLGRYAARFPLLMKPFSAEQLARQIREVLSEERN